MLGPAIRLCHCIVHGAASVAVQRAPLLREFGIERIETVLPTIVSLFSEKPNKQEVETIRVERKWMATRRIPKV